jgi:RecA-family ATPase
MSLPPPVFNSAAPQHDCLGPHNIEIEQALLGAIMLDNRKLVDLGGKLRAEHLYDPLHQRLYATMASTQAGGSIEVTPLTLNALMTGDLGLQDVGGHAYLVRLVQAAPALPNVHDYARLLNDLAVRREMIKIGKGIINSGNDMPLDCSPMELIQNAYAALTQIETPADRLVLVSAASFEGQPVPQDNFLIDGVFPSHCVSMLSGDGGTGKSTLALQLAVAVQFGTNWIGRPVNARGSVLYLAAEDDLHIMHKRLAAIVASENNSLRNLQDLHIVPLVGEDALLTKPTPDGLIAPSGLYHAVYARVRALKPSLVIIDNLSDCFGGDEINRVHARQFVTMLRKMCIQAETTILVLAHPSLSGMSSGRGTSGSTGWPNSVRALAYLDKPQKGTTEEDPDTRVLRLKKSNYGATGTEIKLRWDRGVFITGTDGNSAVNSVAHAKAERVFLELLSAYALQGRKVGPSPSSNYAPTTFAKDQRSAGVGKDAFMHAMNRLLDKSLIQVEETGPPARRTKRLALAAASFR